MIHRIHYCVSYCAQIKTSKIVKRKSYYREVLENFDYHKEIIVSLYVHVKARALAIIAENIIFSINICLFYQSYVSKYSFFLLMYLFINLFILMENIVIRVILYNTLF